jgi:hypothetical protein
MSARVVEAVVVSMLPQQFPLHLISYPIIICRIVNMVVQHSRGSCPQSLLIHKNYDFKEKVQFQRPLPICKLLVND